MRGGFFFPIIFLVSCITAFCYLTSSIPFAPQFTTTFAAVSNLMFPSGQVDTITPWISQYEGWFNKLTPHPSPESFTPTRETLLLVVLRNAQADHEGFTLGVFSSPDGGRLVVDSVGNLFTVPDPSDVDGIIQCAETSTTFPKPDLFRNLWQIQSPVTSRPIERILMPKGDAKLDQVSVQGFTKEGGATPLLKSPVEGYVRLPAQLAELVGLVLEARKDWEYGHIHGPLVQSILGLVDAWGITE